MSKADKINQYDPNGVGMTSGGIFGLPFSPEESDVVIVPVPWEVTVSYQSGAARGPEAVLLASPQLDLFIPEAPDAWKIGIAMEDISTDLKQKSDFHRHQAWEIISFLEEGGDLQSSEEGATMLADVNAACADMVKWVEASTQKWLDQGKSVVLLGGDHSTPLGFIQALAKRHDSFGILQVDAHPDLRDAYEGFTYSHASIMHNALQVPAVTKLYQVGIRDYNGYEAQTIANSGGRIEALYDRNMRKQQFEGSTWSEICAGIVAALPQKVYISFDIDGLDPKLCPSTGTPVPGGLEFEEACYLIECVANSGREIIGCDLVEVAPGDADWDGNVGARLLWRMIVAMARSQKKII